MKKFAIFITVGILVVAIVGFASFFYFDSTKDHSQSILSNCGINKLCIEESLTNLSKTEDRQTVLTTFSSITKIFQKANCHPLGHHLGQFMYEYTENLNEALSLIDRTCGGSIYHGVMQGYFTAKSLSDNGTPTNVVASKTCNELHDFSYSQIRLECAHGVGHGLVIAYNYDAFSAFEGCKVFEDDLGQRNCVEGVGMENAGIYFTPEGATIDEDDLLFPCNVLDEELAIPCIRWHSIYIIRESGWSIEDAFDQCEKNENETFVKYCYYGMGVSGAARYLDNIEHAFPMCQEGSLDYETYCLSGVAHNIADQININQGFEFCKISPQTFQKDCYEILGKFIHTLYFTEEEIENACSQLKNTEYYHVCVNANPEELGLI